jgi:hypothetical protein
VFSLCITTYFFITAVLKTLTHSQQINCEIKNRIGMAFNKNRALFTSKMDLELRNKLVKRYIYSIDLYGAETLDTSGSRASISGKF